MGQSYQASDAVTHSAMPGAASRSFKCAVTVAKMGMELDSIGGCGSSNWLAAAESRLRINRRRCDRCFEGVWKKNRSPEGVGRAIRIAPDAGRLRIGHHAPTSSGRQPLSWRFDSQIRVDCNFDAIRASIKNSTKRGRDLVQCEVKLTAARIGMRCHDRLVVRGEGQVKRHPS